MSCIRSWAGYPIQNLFLYSTSLTVKHQYFFFNFRLSLRLATVSRPGCRSAWNVDGEIGTIEPQDEICYLQGQPLKEASHGFPKRRPQHLSSLPKPAYLRPVHSVRRTPQKVDLPILTTSTPMSSIHASICCLTNSEGVWCTAMTPVVFWAVRAVVAVMA